MATIDVGASHGKRSFDHSLPLVPFIDFLLCLISFLLITAVWSQMARVNADAQVPSPAESGPERPKERTLHVEMKEAPGGYAFKLVWREGSRVLDTLDVPRDASAARPVYPQLAKAIADQWASNEARHFAANDPKFDQIVLHTHDATPFEHVIAMIDAANQTQREWRAPSGELLRRPALNPTFALN